MKAVHYIGEPKSTGRDRLFASLIYPVKRVLDDRTVYRAGSKAEAEGFVAGYHQCLRDRS